MNILVVEDYVVQGESLALLFGVKGHSVYESRTAESAILVAETHPPDLVILDWVIPVGGGRLVYDWLRSREVTRDVPIIITSGLEREAIPAGLVGVKFFKKPFDPKELDEEVDRVEQAVRGVVREKGAAFAAPDSPAPVCPGCNGTKTVTVRVKGLEGEDREESRPCALCGGTGRAGLRTK